MVGLFCGIALMLIGAALYAVGRGSARRSNVHANDGSVAIGGDNSGPISNTKVGGPRPENAGHNSLTTLSIAVEVIGIAVTVWHAIHLAAK
jgi:hypothetical protein